MGLKKQLLTTCAGLFTALAETLGGGRKPPFDFAVVDEAQDISVAHVRFLAVLGENRPNSLFFADDLGQRILQPPFTWKTLAVMSPLWSCRRLPGALLRLPPKPQLLRPK